MNWAPTYFFLLIYFWHLFLQETIFLFLKLLRSDYVHRIIRLTRQYKYSVTLAVT